MACDAISGTYNFASKDRNDHLLAPLSTIMRTLGAPSNRVKDQAKPASIPFFHNDLHDMESLLWAVIWQLFFNRDISPTERPHADESDSDAERAQYARELFPRNHSTDIRCDFLESSDTFSKKLEWIPNNLQDIKRLLDALRESLIDKFRSFKRNSSVVNEESFEGI